MKGARNTQGHVYGFHYGWSGGHRMVAEELPDGRRQIQFGHARGIERTPQTRFETAVLYASFSDEGSNGCAVAFQRHLRDRVLDLPDPSRPRPVHYVAGSGCSTINRRAQRHCDLGGKPWRRAVCSG